MPTIQKFKEADFNKDTLIKATEAKRKQLKEENKDKPKPPRMKVVKKEFINCIEDGGWEPVMDAIRNSEELLEATLEGDETKVASMIEQVHQENTSILKYNDENALACVVSLAYYSSKKDYLVYRELAWWQTFLHPFVLQQQKI